ncbi:MAG: non-reducing end alpha-L-arabinofuranosidase family hydrolase, partial [Deltaproteobacteria bacterium]|nr:non-reducing end alpha-L-arabinofuranosidase family hydrolase [Deltaproteobacteria bacterium]
DIFEASHTYRLKGHDRFLTIVEAQTWPIGRGWRYYKAYVSDRLDGTWTPAATSRQKPFAGLANVQDIGPHWTDSFSHGELIREGFDETLQVDPARLEFLFQGVSDAERAGKKYGEIPWRLGLLNPA